MKRVLLLLLLVGCTPGNKYFLKVDNDYFKPTKNRDVNFTNGVRVGVTTTTGETFYGQHTFYTPVHKHVVPPPEDERPYAGAASVGYFKNERRFDYGLELGVVGPWAGGKQVQRDVHNLLGQGYPDGWDYQLDNRALVIATVKKEVLYKLGSYVDVSPFVGANFGSIFNQTFGGVHVRVGESLPNSPSSGPLFPRVDLSQASDSRVYFIFGPMARNVYYNYLLDGVNHEPWVLEGRLGFVAEIGDYEIGYTYIAQTKEYETEDRGMDFGEVSMGVSW